jgi:ATP-dependent exoDNAse (exonuclease V) beta subunit
MEKKEYDRVTSILVPFSGIEAIPSYILETAAERGTQVHEYIQNKIEGFESPFDLSLTNYIKSFDVFWDESSHIFDNAKVTLEKRLFCDDALITGAIDCIIETPEKTFIFDWKTSLKPQKTWKLQGAAYRYLLEVNGYQNITDPVFVHIKKDGSKPELHRFTNYLEDLEIYMKCLELFRYFDMGKRLNSYQEKLKRD